MPKDYSRTRRVAELIRRELATLIATGLNDPRIGLVTVTGVDVSRDLRHAKVYVTRLDSNGGLDAAIEALNHASGFLGREIGKQVRLRNLPRLSFFFDPSVQRGVELSALIDRVRKEDGE